MFKVDVWADGSLAGIAYRIQGVATDAKTGEGSSHQLAASASAFPFIAPPPRFVLGS
jgi:hypothetical protein